MAICPKCGANVEDGKNVCPACGEPLTAEQPKEETKAEETKEEGPSKAQAAFEKFTDTKDSTGDCDAKDVEDNKILSLFAYIGILVLIPLLAAPKSKFARFHANQGLILLICDIVFGAVAGIFALLGLIPFAGIVFLILLYIVSTIAGLLFLVLMIIGIVNSVTGKAKELPIIGGWFHFLK